MTIIKLKIHRWFEIPNGRRDEDNGMKYTTKNVMRNMNSSNIKCTYILRFNVRNQNNFVRNYVMRSNCYKYDKAIEITINVYSEGRKIKVEKINRLIRAKQNRTNRASEIQLPTEIKTRKQFQST